MIRQAEVRAEALGFRAMGTQCEVQVLAPAELAADLADLARERVELLEQSWSRFRPGSELSRLNAAAGHGPRPVSADMLRLVQRMHRAWTDTDGLFDPTVLTAMTAHGYDADFATVAARPAADWRDVVTASSPGMSAVVIDVRQRTVALPEGIGLDPGAIGKGLAADIVAEELSDAGADGVLVNLGGDISVAGHPTSGSAWRIGIEDERRTPDEDRGAEDDDRFVGILDVPGPRAGVATSTTLKRRWAQGRRHHIIDPRTGAPSTGDLTQVTVAASSASEAEVLATAALLMPSNLAAAWLADRHVSAVLLTHEDSLLVQEGDAHV